MTTPGTASLAHLKANEARLALITAIDQPEPHNGVYRTDVLDSADLYALLNARAAVEDAALCGDRSGPCPVTVEEG